MNVAMLKIQPTSTDWSLDDSKLVTCQMKIILSVCNGSKCRNLLPISCFCLQ